MSKIENRPHAEPPPGVEAAVMNLFQRAGEDFQPVTATSETRQNRVERDDHKNCNLLRIGELDIGELANAAVGDVIEFIDEDGKKRKGRVIRDEDGELTVVFDRDGDGRNDHHCRVDKHNGHCHEFRKATVEEMDMAAAATEMQRASTMQEQRINEGIKVAKIEHTRKLEDRKKEALKEELKQIEAGNMSRLTLDSKRMDYNDALEIRFQTALPDTEHQSISVSQVLFAQETADALKK